MSKLINFKGLDACAAYGKVEVNLRVSYSNENVLSDTFQLSRSEALDLAISLLEAVHMSGDISDGTQAQEIISDIQSYQKKV